jgi:nitrite reductase (NADH) large subunit
MYNYYFASNDTDTLSTLCSNDDWEDLPVQMVVVSAGIKPRDDLARGTDIAVGERGGIVVDDQVSSS